MAEDATVGSCVGLVQQLTQLHGTVSGHWGMTPTVVRQRLEQQSTFLRLTVHELRGPLSVVSGYLSMIRDGSLGPTSRSAALDAALLTIAGSVQSMAALVDGLAAVARHEDRPDALRCRPSLLGPVVAAAIAAVELEADVRQVGIELRGAEVEADVDAGLLGIALRNLLANAIHHSLARSAVVVAIKAEGAGVAITVTDTGPGIALADREHIFDAWHRSVQSDGLGLGLWIVRRIAEWHGGRVTLESAPGGGSTFAINLPGRLWVGSTR